MKSRNIVLWSVLACVAGGLYFLIRSPSDEASRPNPEDGSATRSMPDDPVEEPSVVVNGIPAGSTEPASPQEPNESAPRSTAADPIPFALVAMSELEEIDLTNAEAPHSHKIREWKGRLEPGLREIKVQLDTEGDDGVLAISLPNATQVKVTDLRYQPFGSNQGVISGKILGDPFGEVVLSYVNQAVAGSIRSYRSDEVWEIRNAGEGSQYIALVDVDALGVCGVCAEHAGQK